MSYDERIRETVMFSEGVSRERDTPFYARTLDEYLFWCARSNGRRFFYAGPDAYFDMPGVSVRIDGGNVTERSVRAWIDRRDMRARELGLTLASKSLELAHKTLEYLARSRVPASDNHASG